MNLYLGTTTPLRPPCVHQMSFTWQVFPDLSCFSRCSASVYWTQTEEQINGVGLKTRLNCEYNGFKPLNPKLPNCWILWILVWLVVSKKNDFYKLCTAARFPHWHRRIPMSYIIIDVWWSISIADISLSKPHSRPPHLLPYFIVSFSPSVDSIACGSWKRTYWHSEVPCWPRSWYQHQR